MKLTKRKLKNLIETFLAGEKGVVNLESKPYDYLDDEIKSNPQLTDLDMSGPEGRKQAAHLMSMMDPDVEELVDYEEYIRDFAGPSTPGKQSTDFYAANSKLYDNPRLKSDIKLAVKDYVGNLYDFAMDIARKYYGDRFLYHDGVLNVDQIIMGIASDIVTYIKQTRPHLGLVDIPFKNFGFGSDFDEKGLNKLGMPPINELVYNMLYDLGVDQAINSAAAESY